LEALEDRCLPSVSYHRGAIFNNVQVETVYLGSQWSTSGGPQAAQRIDQFVQYLLQSPYMDMLGEYTTTFPVFGPTYVGRGQWVNHYIYNSSIPNTIDDSSSIENWLVSQINNKALPSLPDFNNLYLLILPPGVSTTSIRSYNATHTDKQELGYHASIANPSSNPSSPITYLINYVVIPYPGQGNPFISGLTDAFNSLTPTISHELAETVTDPNLGKVYGLPTGPFFIGGDTTGSWYQGNDYTNAQEIGDLAEGYYGNLNGYVVQAEWSNRNNRRILPPGAQWLTIGSGASGLMGADTPGTVVGPAAYADTYHATAGVGLNVSAAGGVLANDSDPFGNGSIPKKWSWQP
jgi:hypothetical protein